MKTGRLITPFVIARTEITSASTHPIAVPQVILALDRWKIPVREIDRWLRGLAECVVDRIARHADDREASRARLYATANRIRAIQVTADKLLIDDGLCGRRPIPHLGKVVSLQERDGHHLEVSRRDRVGNSSILPRLRAHAALHSERPCRNSMQVQRNTRCDGGGLYVRQGSQPFQQARSKFAFGRLVGIPSA